jgi:hypothetical protein
VPVSIGGLSLATTILSGFNSLRSNLEITGLQAATVSTRQRNVRDAVATELEVQSSFLVGSYSRDTMISPLKDADIDIFTVLASNYYEKYRPAALLDRVRTVLLKTYTKTPKISRNGQAVTITFTDFKVDVVPAYNRQGGGYIIPDSTTDSWISTNPEVHDSTLSAANKDHAGRLKPLIKMIKGWNRNLGGAFDGFYLELMTKDILTGMTISDYSSGVRYVLDKGRERIKFKQPDPAGYGGYINGLAAVGTVENALSRFTTAYNRAVKAEDFAKRDKLAQAFDEWGKIFGDYFPTYG